MFKGYTVLYVDQTLLAIIIWPHHNLNRTLVNFSEIALFI